MSGTHRLKASRHFLGCALLAIFGDVAAQDHGIDEDGPVERHRTSPAESDKRWGGTLSLASQYVAGGFHMSWGQPALQGGIDYSHPSGWYAGLWASTVSPYAIEGAGSEWDVQLGYARTLGDFRLGGSIQYYMYPGASMAYAGGASYDYGDITATASYRWLTVRYLWTYTRDYFGYNSVVMGRGVNRHSRGSSLADIGATVDIGSDYALAARVGYRYVRGFQRNNLFNAKVEVTRRFGENWQLRGTYMKAWSKHGVLTNYTTGVPDSSGRIHYRNSIAGTFFVTLTRTF
ncbi:TorF family putative porin [Dyella tabacisoli]|uniref:Choline dehydrogenase n=1 Tax=Dyella tabacisoli TaxID=2282381 RepID=A0A369URS8_9GAMM|nr:TorF family putative porin [Dyella tabacisoli]RDD82330.1 choline dehydrogenase [Dyella tabacisoli]